MIVDNVHGQRHWWAPMALSFSCSVDITTPTVSKWTTRGLNDTHLLERDLVGPIGQPAAGSRTCCGWPLSPRSHAPALGTR